MSLSKKIFIFSFQSVRLKNRLYVKVETSVNISETFQIFYKNKKKLVTGTRSPTKHAKSQSLFTESWKIQILAFYRPSPSGPFRRSITINGSLSLNTISQSPWCLSCWMEVRLKHQSGRKSHVKSTIYPTVLHPLVEEAEKVGRSSRWSIGVNVLCERVHSGGRLGKSPFRKRSTGNGPSINTN